MEFENLKLRTNGDNKYPNPQYLMIRNMIWFI